MRMSTAIGLALLPKPAMACTLCHSAQATSVRTRLLGPDLLWNLAAILLPLAGLLAIVALVLCEPAKPGRA